jgi:hypothetical protein
MAQDFWVDESDNPYPAIRHRSHPEFMGSHAEIMTLAQAQRRIKEICRSHRQHWLAVMHRQLDQTPKDIIQDAIYAGRTE